MMHTTPVWSYRAPQGPALRAGAYLDEDFDSTEEWHDGLGIQVEQMREECAKEEKWLRQRHQEILRKLGCRKGGMRDGQPKFSSHLPEMDEYILRVCRHKLQEERLRKMEACEEPIDEDLEYEGQRWRLEHIL